MKKYFTKCSQKAVDCVIQCPECDSDTREYVLLCKLIAGRRESALKREVFQSCDQFMDVDSLRTDCVAYEGCYSRAMA